MIRVGNEPTINDVKDKLQVVIFGPYSPPKAKSQLSGLKKRLIESGYKNCKIVEDFDYPIKNRGENESAYILRKSYYWVGIVDVRIFLFLKNADNAGVALELKHMIERFPEKTNYSIVGIENGKTSQLIKGEILLNGRILRIDFSSAEDLKDKVTGTLLNFLKELYNELANR